MAAVLPSVSSRNRKLPCFGKKVLTLKGSTPGFVECRHFTLAEMDLECLGSPVVSCFSKPETLSMYNMKLDVVTFSPL